MKTNAVSPHIQAAADQFLAAARQQEDGQKIGSDILNWVRRQWITGVDPVTVDRAVADLAFYLARQIPTPLTWSADHKGVRVDAAEALQTRPDLHWCVVPMVLVECLMVGDEAGAVETWGRMQLAYLRNDRRQQARAVDVARALMVLALAAGCAPSNRSVK